MQRQSLGSPGSKHLANGGPIAGAIAVTGNFTGGALAAVDATKAEKLVRSSPRSSRTVHLIPILTVLCILILYLVSHEPSPLDLPSTRGIERVIDEKAGSVSAIVSAAIRTKRGLMEEKKVQIRNRRLGDSEREGAAAAAARAAAAVARVGAASD